jgi:hypothetical protein
MEIKEENNVTTITTDNAEIWIRQRQPRRSYRQYNAKPRIYVWAQNEETILENLENRKRRPHKIWRKGVKEAFAEVGLSFDFDGMVWSQYAGCSCPCSPGFVAKKQTLTIGEKNFYQYDIHVTLKNSVSIDETKEKRNLTVLV